MNILWGGGGGGGRGRRGREGEGGGRSSTRENAEEHFNFSLKEVFIFQFRNNIRSVYNYKHIVLLILHFLYVTMIFTGAQRQIMGKGTQSR